MITTLIAILVERITGIHVKANVAELEGDETKEYLTNFIGATFCVEMLLVSLVLCIGKIKSWFKGS